MGRPKAATAAKLDHDDDDNMIGMFLQAASFNGDLSAWNVQNVTDMDHMFQGTTFNGDLSAWNVENVTDMGRMFAEATSFNGDLSTWNVADKGIFQMFVDAPISAGRKPRGYDVGIIVGRQ